MTTFLADSITQPINLEFTTPDFYNADIRGVDGTVFRNFRVKNTTWNDDMGTNATAVEYAPYILQQVQVNMERQMTAEITGTSNSLWTTYHPSLCSTTNATVSNGVITLDLEATYNNSNSIYWTADYVMQGISPAEQLKQIMQERQAPRIITSKSIARTSDIREVRARETLRRVLGLKNFGTFMTRGFVSIKAKSGLMYQIFPGHGITNVYNKGKKIETLCVVLTRNFAATDSLIMRYLLILNNEDRFRSLAVRHAVGNGNITFSNSGVYCVTQQREDKSLAQIYKEIKAMAA